MSQFFIFFIFADINFDSNFLKKLKYNKSGAKKNPNQQSKEISTKAFNYNNLLSWVHIIYSS